MLGFLLHSNVFKNTDTEDNRLHFSGNLNTCASRILHLIIYCVQGHFSAISFNDTLKVQFNICSQLSKSKFERHHTSKNSVWKEGTGDAEWQAHTIPLRKPHSGSINNPPSIVQWQSASLLRKVYSQYPQAQYPLLRVYCPH